MRAFEDGTYTAEALRALIDLIHEHLADLAPAALPSGADGR